jgi:hypothetical protein
MRHAGLRHLAGERSYKWKSESTNPPKGVPADGGRADAKLRQRVGFGAGARSGSYSAVSLAKVTPGEAGSADTSPVRELRKEIRDLKRVLAEKTLEANFFKGVRMGP